MVMLKGSSHNINNVLNRNKNKPNDPVATVPKDDIIVLPYSGLHCNQITWRLKSCINNLHSCQCQGCFSEHTPPQILLSLQGQPQPISVIQGHIRLVAGIVTIFTLEKPNEEQYMRDWNLNIHGKALTKYDNSSAIAYHVKTTGYNIKWG